MVRAPRPQEPAVAARSDALPGVGVGDHVAADPGERRHRVLRALHGAFPRPRGTRRCAARRCARALDRARVLLAGAQPPSHRGGGAGPPRRGDAARSRRPRRPAGDRAFDRRRDPRAQPRRPAPPSSTATSSACSAATTASAAGRGEGRIERALWGFAERHTPHEDVAAYTQAIMDLGAALCVRSRPLCAMCPLEADCTARREGAQTKYPAPRPRRETPRRETAFLVLRDPDGALLLERRPPGRHLGRAVVLPGMRPRRRRRGRMPVALRRPSRRHHRARADRPWVYPFQARHASDTRGGGWR